MSTVASKVTQYCNQHSKQMAFIEYENEKGPQIVFFDDNATEDDVINLALELGLIEKVED